MFMRWVYYDRKEGELKFSIGPGEDVLEALNLNRLVPLGRRQELEIKMMETAVERGKFEVEEWIK